MANYHTVKNNFTGGEFSPRASARTDFSKFQNSVQEALNYIIFPLGGAVRRPGSRYVAPTKSNGSACLIPFQFSNDQAYMLEFGSQYIRFFADQGQIVVDDTDAAITNGDFPTNLSGWSTSGATWVSPGRVNIAGSTGYIEQSVSIGASFANTDHVIKFSVSTNSVKLRIGTTSGGTNIVNDAEFEPGFHCYEFDPGGATTIHVRFLRDSSGTTSLDNISLLDDEPLEIGSPYSSSCGNIIRFAQSADVMYLAISNAQPYSLSRRGNASWSLELFQPTANPFSGANNYPRAVAFYEDRLIFAGTNNEPQTVWGSKSGDYDDFTIGANPEDAFKYTLAAEEVNAVQWLSPGKVLAIGTAGGEFVARANSLDEAITPVNVRIIRDTTRGSANVRPVRVDSTVMFAQYGANKINEFLYRFDRDAYVVQDMTILAEHLLRNKQAVVMAHQRNPQQTLWVVRNDGVLLGLTYEREEEVVAWHRHEFGGTDVKVLSIGIIPGDTHDEIWIIVERTIDGGTKRYVEFFEETFPIDESADLENAFYVDSGLTYDGSATTTLTGLDHLEGETVSVLVNGAVHPEVEVTSGAIELTTEATKAAVGLKYTSRLVDQTPQIDSRFFNSQGRRITIHRAGVYLHNTLGLQYGSSVAKLDILPFRKTSDAMDAPPTLFSGLKTMTFPSNWDASLSVTLVQDQPLPSTLLGTVYWLSAGSV